MALFMHGERKVSFQSIGEGGSPVVLLHSLGGRGDMWQDLPDEVRGPHRFICLDAPGHGATSWTDKNPIIQYTNDAAALVDHLGLSSFHVLGLSMGGQVAMRLALAMPDRVESLFLANTSPGRGLSAHDATAPGREDHAKIGTQAFAQKYVDSRFANPSAARLRDAYVEWVAATLPEVYFATLGAILEADLTPALEQISQQVWVVTGDRDVSTPFDTARRLADAIPSAKLKILRDTGHFSVLDNCAGFARLVNAWLDEA